MICSIFSTNIYLWYKHPPQNVDPGAEQLKVTQYHFTSWPDHGVPKFATSLISFIRRVQKGHNKDSNRELLVHCSAGVGRTGTFITLDTMLERIRQEDSVNVYAFVHNMRQRRVLMVQTLVGERQRSWSPILLLICTCTHEYMHAGLEAHT